ncbi:transglutaminase domain-containing protein [Candidatus Woesebacteria bacterium]|nr:transglutaminase domain-containing protein [Candidatus Woesebacteria bacterium]
MSSKTGEVWEVSIPRLEKSDQYRSYTLTLSVSSALGKEAYLSPKSEKVVAEAGQYIYTYSKGEIEKTGIVAGFGEFQVFGFTLNYHLENPLTKPALAEIAIPPDTAIQKVYLTEVSPKPINITKDEEGNWIANYTLKSRDRVDVIVKGSVQIFATPRKFEIPNREVLTGDLGESQYWQVNDSKIKQLAANLKTPKAIYDYVTSSLSYDYSRVKPNVTRLGALGALNNPKNAICTEFTDLTIALLRAAGIPAREVNGYAYTENPTIQPLSLVADVLHAWPEYWDSQKLAWIPIDPTWGSTTGGEDFFNKLDLRHFAFVMHGKDSQKPYPPGSYKLGPNPQKDVFVTIGSLPLDRNGLINIQAEYKKKLPFLGDSIEVRINNVGTSTLYGINEKIIFDGKLSSDKNIDYLIPFSSDTFTIKVPFTFLGKNTPSTVSILAGDKKIEVPTNKTEVLIYSLLVLFLIFGLIIGLILLQFKKNYVNGKLLDIGKIFRRKGDDVTQPINQNSEREKQS